MDEREYKRRIEAKRRIIPQSEIEKQDTRNDWRSAQEKTSKRQYGMFAATVLLLAVTIVGFAFFLLFNVQQVEVTGNEYSTSGEIVEWLDSDLASMNSIAMCVKYNFLNAQLPSQVESITVKFRNPWTLSVEAIDKEPVAGLLVEENYIYCDIDGIVLLESTMEVEGLPLIDGIEVGEYTLYSVVSIEDVDIFRNALEVISILNIQEIDFQSISCSSGASVNIVIDNIIVKLGEDNYQEKIMQLSPILEEVGDREGTLNLENYSSSSTSITFTQASTTEDS